MGMRSAVRLVICRVGPSGPPIGGHLLDVISIGDGKRRYLPADGLRRRLDAFVNGYWTPAHHNPAVNISDVLRLMDTRWSAR